MSQIDVLSRVINSFIFKGKSLNSRKKFKSQSQSSRGVLRKRCFENMQQIYRRTPMPKCDFNKVAAIALRHGCSPVNLLHIFRTPFPENTSGGLLLKSFLLFHFSIIFICSFRKTLWKGFATQQNKCLFYKKCIAENKSLMDI